MKPIAEKQMATNDSTALPEVDANRPHAAFGYLQQHTGSITGGLYGLGVASLIAAAAGFLTRDRRIDRDALPDNLRSNAR